MSLFYGDVEVTLEGFDRFIGLLDSAADPDTGISASCMRRYATQALKVFWDNTPLWQKRETDDLLPKGNWLGELRDGWLGLQKDMTPERYARNFLRVRRGGRGYTVDLKNESPYAAYVEFGHRQHPGMYAPGIHTALSDSWAPEHPFIRPAFAKLESNILVDMDHAVGVELKARGFFRR